MSKRLSVNSHTFVLDQAIYNTKGVKLGWVEAVLENFGNIPGSQKAMIRCVRGGSLDFVSEDLRLSRIFTKSGLRSASLPRISPAVIFPGNRLFEGMLYRGAVTRVISSITTPSDFVCHTDLSQCVTVDAIQMGKVKIGKR